MPEATGHPRSVAVSWPKAKQQRQLHSYQLLYNSVIASSRAVASCSVICIADAGFVTKRANSAIRVKGIDEPSDSDNTWENAESDGKKGARPFRAVFQNHIAQDVCMGHRFGLQSVQV